MCIHIHASGRRHPIQKHIDIGSVRLQSYHEVQISMMALRANTTRLYQRALLVDPILVQYSMIGTFFSSNEKDQLQRLAKLEIADWRVQSSVSCKAAMLPSLNWAIRHHKGRDVSI